jgi:hypothetical protein
MIVYNLHFKGVTIPPIKTDAPSLVDAYTVLPCPVTSELLQSICRWNAQVVQCDGTIQHPKLAQGNLLKVVRQPSGAATSEYLLSLFALERPDHEVYCIS